MSYHTINEEAARRANDMNSFRDYKAGSATAEYRRMVDAATELAERQKQRVDPMYHEKIDRLLEIYCRKLAENMNASYSIEARCPSILISGGGNFRSARKRSRTRPETATWKSGTTSRACLIKSAASAPAASAPMTRRPWRSWRRSSPPWRSTRR